MGLVSRPSPMSNTARAILLVLAAVAVMATGVPVTVHAQRTADDGAFDRSRAGTELLTAQVNMETGLRGYMAFGRRQFLQPYRSGRREFQRALDDARHAAGDNTRLMHLLDRQAEISMTWQAL